MSAIQQENAKSTTRSNESCEPVLGVTLYDRVTALLLTLIVTLGGVTLVFGALWAANHPWGPGTKISKIMDQPTLTEDEDDFGGKLDGLPNDTDPFVPGVAGRDPSTPQDDQRPSSDAPDLNEVITSLVNQIGATSIDLDQVTFQPDIPRSYLATGSDSTGKRGPLGDGPGKEGGVPAAKRWEIIFERGLTEDQYARQLDFFKVELATVAGGKLYRVSNLASPQPTVRVGQADKELFFQWRDAARRMVDLGLLRKAKELPLAENAIVLHFYSRETESKLRQMEREYATQHGRADLHQVAKTKFVVKKTESGYDFEVAKQTYLVQQM